MYFGATRTSKLCVKIMANPVGAVRYYLSLVIDTTTNGSRCLGDAVCGLLHVPPAAHSRHPELRTKTLEGLLNIFHRTAGETNEGVEELSRASACGWDIAPGDVFGDYEGTGVW